MTRIRGLAASGSVLSRCEARGKDRTDSKRQDLWGQVRTREGQPLPPPHPTQQEANTRCVVIHLTNTLEDLPYAATLVGTRDTVLNETCMSCPGKIYVMKKRRQTAKKNKQINLSLQQKLTQHCKATICQ